MNMIASIRLASHQLSESHCQTPEEVVAWLGAVQAQDYNMAKLAIVVRLSNAGGKTVEAAFNRGKILRTHVLRPTWHFVSPENIRWMLALSAERIKAASRSRDRDLEITEALYTQTNDLIQKALEGKRHLTREALEQMLGKAGIPVDSARMYHFLMRAEVEGIVCSGALQGKDQTYALLEERVAATPLLHKEEALAKLAQIYFRSHGPATLLDFAWWSGLPVSEARQGLEAVNSQFIAEDIAGQTYWMAPEFQQTPEAENLCRFLPAFDEYLIAYKDRTPILLSEHHNKAISSNGVFRPVVTVNGKVVGLWKKAPNKKKPIALNFFEKPDADTKRVVETESRPFYYLTTGRKSRTAKV